MGTLSSDCPEHSKALIGGHQEIKTYSFRVTMAMTVFGLVAALFFVMVWVSIPGRVDAGFECARPQLKLKHPVVILVSSDGFRFGYQYKTHTPNIQRLISDGTSAETGMIPVFPTLTFPNHYSIVTGLYPAWHGIINNYFRDPETNDTFNMQNHEPKWWLGEPLWETVTKHGLQAATYFWPGSEVVKGPWNCPKEFCQQYNGSVPFEERVDTVLGYFDLKPSEMPRFITLYFEDPDHQGHQVGPDDPQITEAVAHIDSLMGRLMNGLEQRGVLDDVTIIMVGDHGMVGTCDKKLIFLEDLSPWITIPSDWIQYYSPLLSIRPPPGVSPSEVVAKMREGLNSGKVKNGEYLKVFLKEDLPDRLHYSSNENIPPIIGLAAEGFKIEKANSKSQECGGAHGYDNAFFSMRTVFFGHGPRFARGRKVPSFENVEIYNLITSILDIPGAPNNGTQSFARVMMILQFLMVLVMWALLLFLLVWVLIRGSTFLMILGRVLSRLLVGVLFVMRLLRFLSSYPAVLVPISIYPESWLQECVDFRVQSLRRMLRSLLTIWIKRKVINSGQ